MSEELDDDEDLGELIDSSERMNRLRAMDDWKFSVLLRETLWEKLPLASYEEDVLDEAIHRLEDRHVLATEVLRLQEMQR